MLCLVIGIATFIEGYDEASVTNLSPYIARYFNIGMGDASWIITVYLLFMAGLILIFGKICDNGAIKKVLVVGIIVFIVGDALCVLSVSFHMLLVSRAIKGIGAATLWCSSIMLGVRYLPKDLVVWALVATTAGEILGCLTGPVISGILLLNFTWQSSFVISLIFGFIALVMALKIVPRDNYHGIGEFDYIGAVMLAIAMFSGTYCIEILVFEGLTLMGIVLPLVFITALALFIHRCMTIDNPIVDLELFKSWRVNCYTIIYMMELICVTGAAYLTSFYLTSVLDLESLEKGLLMVLPSVITFVSCFGIMNLAIKHRNELFITLVCIMMILMSLALIFVEYNPMVLIIITLLLSGLLTSIGEITIVPRIINSSRDSKRGASSAMNTYLAYVAVALGTALFSKLFVIGSGSNNVLVDNLSMGSFMDGYFLATIFSLILGIIALSISFALNKNRTDTTGAEIAGTDPPMEP